MKPVEYPFINLDEVEIDPATGRLIAEHLARRYKAIPIGKREGALLVAMANPCDVIAVDDIRLATGLAIDLVQASEVAIHEAIEHVFTGRSRLPTVQRAPAAAPPAREVSPEALRELADEAPVIRVVNLIIAQAISDGAREIHIVPGADEVAVKYLVDGVLHDVMTPPKHILPAVTARLKIMANLCVENFRAPQQGTIYLRHDDRSMELSLKTEPTPFGEKVVMAMR